jgi:hypothetical protein
MSDDAAQSQAIGASRKPGPWSPDERAIDAIAQLLASERPLSEILHSVKRAADADDPAQSNDPQDRFNSETMPLPEPVAATLTHAHVQNRTGALDPNGSAVAALDVGASHGRRSPPTAPVRQKWQSRLVQLHATTLLWLIPAVPLGAVALASLIPLAADSAAFGTVPDFLGAEAGKAGSTIMPAEPDRGEARSKLPDRAEPQLTSAQIKALLDRGDALVGDADIASARISYEQAAAAGDSEAALRLGATYDPSFLAQAELQNVRGEVTIAQYWYGRARDLKASPMQLSWLGPRFEVTPAAPAKALIKPGTEAGAMVKASDRCYAAQIDAADATEFVTASWPPEPGSGALD